MKGMAPIAIRAPSPGPRDVPINVRADALHKWSESSEANGAMAGLGLMPQAMATGLNGDQSPPGEWCDEQLKRAIAAAEEAGIASYRIEIAPNGTITIVVPAPPEG